MLLAVHIAFDLDDTLIPCGFGFATEPPGVWWLRPFVPERLRAGSAALFRELATRGHQLSVYTTSFRSPFQVRLTFLGYGVRLVRVVNHRIHDKCIRRLAGRRALVKDPSAFGMDDLVDDSAAVEVDGLRFGWRGIRVAPDDADWVERVLAAVRAGAVW